MTTAEPSTTNPAAGQPASRRTPVPHEAKGQFPHLTDEGADALRDVMTAVNGFYYPGDRSDAIASAIAWLQEHPQACAALGLGLARSEHAAVH